MLVYSIIVVLHVIAAMVAVGAVSVVDYLHLVSIKKKKLEKKLVEIYPIFSRVINIALSLIFLTGFFLVFLNKELLQSSLFITKFILVLIVTINGVYLQRAVSPKLDICVLKGTKHCTKQLLNKCAIAGSISIVTWYSIIILSLTKELGYSVKNFVITYLMALIIVSSISYFMERRARKWR